MLLVFCDQQIDGVLWDGDFADRVFRFWAGDVLFACVVSPCLLADGNRFVFNVQVRPLERHQLALAQTADEFEIEHRQDAALVSSGQVGLDLLRRQDLHFMLWNFRRYAVICRIAHDQPFFDRTVKGVMEHRVDATNCRIAQSGLLPFLRFS